MARGLRPAAARWLDARRFELALAALILVSLVFNPYEFGASDHAYKIPFLKAHLDPALYPRDLVVGMRDYYTSYFHFLIYPLLRFLSWRAAFFALYVLTQIVFFASISLIAERLSGRKSAGLLAVALLMFPRPVLGGIGTFDTLLLESSIAPAGILLALYLLLAERWLAAGLVFGLAAAIHVVTAVNSLLFAGFYVLLLALAGRQPRALARQAAVFSLPAGAGLLAVLLKRLSLKNGSALVLVDPEWMRMILMRSPWHFVPEYRLFAEYALAGVLLAALIWRLAPRERARLILPVYASAWLAMAAGFSLGALFSTKFPLLAGIDLCLFRASAIFVVLSYILAACLIDALLARAPAAFSWSQARLAAAVAALIAGLLACGLRPRIGHPLTQERDANVDAQLWLREHTSRDALVLAPPDEKDFRVYSERSTFASWKDWTYNDLDRGFAVEMLNRLHEVCGLALGSCANPDACRAACKQAYRRLTAEELRPLIARYGITHVVRDERNPLALRAVYRNEQYVIYNGR